MQFSVVICTHNPRAACLCRVVAALKEQSFPAEHWELLVVDNASKMPVQTMMDLSWKTHARVVEEPTLGLTNARLRGIAESTGEVIVFVDDDNVLAANYLAVADGIARGFPKLGVWGGQSVGEFETTPSADASIYLTYLAVRTFTGDTWGNVLRLIPFGAGMCVRRVVAEKYATNVAADERRRQLGRIGANLNSCEDSDIVFTSLDLGMGVGLFADLMLTHIIPASRLEPAYLYRLVENTSYSKTMFDLIRNRLQLESPKSLKRQIVDTLVRVYKTWRATPALRKYLREVRHGTARALDDFKRATKSQDGEGGPNHPVL